MAERLVKRAARVPGLPAHERAVLVYLADAAGRRLKECARSHAEIAAGSGTSVRHAHRAIRRLRERGLIDLLGKKYSGVNRYRLNLGPKNAGNQESDGLIASGLWNEPEKQKGSG